MSKLIFGCGYLGHRVAARWRDEGQRVFVVTRSAQRARELAGEGYGPIVANVAKPETLAGLPAATTVLHAIGYDPAGGASVREVVVAGLQSILDALPTETGKFIYVSSTGVYGQTTGEWVDESSACHPMRERTRACLEAEGRLAAHPLGARSVVLRMAGLYGPGRIPNQDAIRRGEPIAATPCGFLNLIHVDDAAEVVLAAARRAPTPRTYVVADGAPVERRAYYAELARLLGSPVPVFAEPNPDSPRAARAASDKRASNARMMAELGVTLRHPSYREGLAAIVAAGPQGRGSSDDA